MSGDKAIKRLAEFLRLPDLTHDAGKKYRGLRNFERDSDQVFYSKIWDQGVTKSRIGRHREILNADEIKIVKNTTRKLRDMFG